MERGASARMDPEQSRIHRVASALSAIVMILAAAAAVTFGIVMRTYHLQLEPVLSGSMRPAAAPGDLIIARRTPTKALNVGDVVAFFPPGTTDAPVMHRIMTLERNDDVTTITTKGDANNTVDTWGPVTLRDAETYRMVYVVPRVGFASVWFEHVAGATGRGALLITAGVLMVALTTIGLFRRNDIDHIRDRQQKVEEQQ